MKKTKIKKEDIVVFAFKKGSQTRFEDSDNSTYRFVDSSIERMMKGYSVVSEKIGISVLQREIQGSVDLCYKCNLAGHFATKCPNVKISVEKKIKKSVELVVMGATVLKCDVRPANALPRLSVMTPEASVTV